MLNNNDTLKLNKILNPQTIEPKKFNESTENNELNIENIETNYFQNLKKL